MLIGTIRESDPNERRVAITPASAATLIKSDMKVIVESGSGEAAGFADAMYQEAGAEIADAERVCETADVLCRIGAAGALDDDPAPYRAGLTVVALCDALGSPDAARALAERNVNLISLELVPRTTRAQTMDVLSSQAVIAGYKAVILAATHLPRIFPMMMTAAGTIRPARAFVIGAGVAGLQAIATAKRLGALVEAYDVREVAREQVESVGGRFLAIELETDEGEGAGGYAREMDETFYAAQRELMAEAVARSNIVITTAAIPGPARAPMLVTGNMLESMPAGGVVVDLAAATGGNCDVTQADTVVKHAGVTVLGPTNLASTVPHDASEMFGRNVVSLLKHIVRDGALVLDDAEDEIITEIVVTRDGAVVHERVIDAMKTATT